MEVYPITKSYKGDYFIYDPDLTHRTNGCCCVCLDEIRDNIHWGNDTEVYPDGDFPYIDEVRYWYTTDNCNGCSVLIASSDHNCDAREFDKKDIEDNLIEGYTFDNVKSVAISIQGSRVIINNLIYKE